MSTAAVLLGIDFGGTKIAIAVADPRGRMLASTTVDSAGELGARAAFERGVLAAEGLLAETGGRELTAVGVSTFGIPFDDRVELAPSIPGWDVLPLGHELRKAFPGAHIRMATDAKAAARAEATWGALTGCDPAIYLNLGTGLSAAIIVGGQVLVGRNGASGEIGYNLRGLGDVGIGLDNRVPLEWMVSARALAKRASAAAGSGRDLTAAEAFEASAGDAALAGVIDNFVTELAYHLVNLAIAIDPSGGYTGQVVDVPATIANHVPSLTTSIAAAVAARASAILVGGKSIDPEQSMMMISALLPPPPTAGSGGVSPLPSAVTVTIALTSRPLTGR